MERMIGLKEELKIESEIYACSIPNHRFTIFCVAKACYDLFV